jgi:hypothetical protein
MKKALSFSLHVFIIFVLYSCTKHRDIWEDNIHLSTKAVEFSASGDSVIIKTGGIWWWVSDISVDGKWYYAFNDVNIQTDSYTIKQDCFEVERRDKNSLFIKIDANTSNVKRIITVGFEAGDYFDRVTITQKSK